MRFRSLFCVEGETEKFIIIKDPVVIGKYKNGTLIRHPFRDSHYYVVGDLLISERVGGSMELLKELVKRGTRPLDYAGKYRIAKHMKRIQLIKGMR